MEDVLVQMNKFYYLVDFIVLEMPHPTSILFSAPIIHGRPFLATTNTMINYKSGILKITFGNMIFETNVFSVYKMLSDCDDSKLQVVDQVQNFILLDLYSIIDSKSCCEDYYPKKSGVIDDFEDVLNDSIPITFDELCIDDSIELEDVGHIGKWRGPSFENLDPLEITKPSFEEIPTLELKKLHDDL